MEKERDEKRQRQRRLFLRYFDEFEAAGLDPAAVMNLAFSINSGDFLRRAIEGMELFRARCRPPIEFFWALEDAPGRLRDQVFKHLNRNDLAGLAGELDGIATREKMKAAKFWRAQKLGAIKTVDELARELRRVAPKFEADGEMLESLLGAVPGKTIANVLSRYLEKRMREKRRGHLPFREMAVAILLKLERSDGDPATVLRTLDAARKEKRRPPRKRRRAKTATHSS